jgi:Mg/Co/Ni transporter MgtE
VVNEQPLDRAALQALPEDALGELRKAVAAARYDDIVEIVETIRTTEPDVATRLLRMVKSFDYAGMRDLLGR